jgi:hypothetical protein
MKLRKPKPVTPPAVEAKREQPKANKPVKQTPNPPHTTTGWITSPKFGSAGSGGAEFESDLEKD